MINSLWNNADIKTVIKNYSALLIIQGANFILPLITFPYLVRILGTEKFGLVMFAQAFCTILYVFVDFGFSLSATRRISLATDKPEETAKIFSSVLAIKLFFSIIVFFIYIIIIYSFSRFEKESLVYILSFGFVLGQTFFPDWFFQGIEKMQLITIINLIAKSIFTGFIFLLINEQGDYFKVPLFNAMAYILAGLISLIICLKHTRFVKPNRMLMKDLINESSSLFVSNFAARLFNSANVFILGLIAGDTFSGIYASMEKVVIAIKTFFTPLYQAMFPWLSKQNLDEQKKAIKKLFPYILAISTAFTLIVLFFGDIILELLFNDPQINSFTIIFKIISVTAIFSALNMLFITLFLPASKQYRKRMYVLLTGGIFNVIASTILVSFFNIYGTAISVVITEFILLVLGWFYFKNSSKTLFKAV